MSSLTTAEERMERIQSLQKNTQAVFNLLQDNRITLEQGRLALELLQLQADLVEMHDSLARRTQAGSRQPAHKQ